MQDIAAVLLTFDRSPGRNYLAETLGNLKPSLDLATRLEGPASIVENGDSCAFASATKMQIFGPGGIFFCSIKGPPNEAVAGALDLTSDSKWILFLEDDIDVCGNFVDSAGAWLDDYADPDIPVYALGVNSPAVMQHARKGIHAWRYPTADFYGTQAVAIRAEAAPEIAAYLREHCYRYGERGAQYDHLIRDWLLEQGVDELITPCPSFVQHIGRTSSIDPRAVIHIFPSFPGKAWSYLAARRGFHGARVMQGELDRVHNVAVLTPFRNARATLPKYFSQIADLQGALPGHMTLRLVAAEGDSQDGTRERIQELAEHHHVSLQLIPTDHGGGPWGSVEDPERLRAMSGVMNAALEAVTEDDGIVVWVMSDLEWDVETMLRLIAQVSNREECRTDSGYPIDIVAPMTYINGIFYDTWAYRAGGERFTMAPPYHPELVGADLPVEIDSAGSCLVMSATVAKSARASDLEAVSFCNHARGMGFTVAVDPSLSIHHRSPIQGKSLLILGQGPSHCTGLSRPIRYLLPELAERGISPTLIAINYDGEPHPLPYKIWPAAVNGQLPMGEQRLLNLLASEHFDGVLIQAEPWNMPSYLRAIDALPEGAPRPPVIGWIGVDGVNNDGEALNGLDHVVTWTQFGAEDLRKGGYAGPISVVPLGVDLATYYPVDKTEARATVLPNLPEGAFVVGTVARNQRRKRIDLIVETFARWIEAGGENTENAILYLHLSGAREGYGYDIGALVRHWGLRGRVMVSNGQELPEATLCYLYSCFDVYINLSEAEGWGLPAMEAAACGVPIIVPEWGGIAEWAPDEAKIFVDSASACMPLHPQKRSGVIGMTPNVESAVGAITVNAITDAAKGTLWRDSVSAYTWERSIAGILAVIEEVISAAQGCPGSLAASKAPARSTAGIGKTNSPGLKDSHERSAQRRC
jgi:glycosyltransferase involved in cell wall biosynthesis